MNFFLFLTNIEQITNVYQRVFPKRLQMILGYRLLLYLE